MKFEVGDKVKVSYRTGTCEGKKRRVPDRA